jgi:hypothetical protein
MEKFEAPFLYGVTFYPNTASNYIISIILRCLIKANVQNTKLYITIIPSFQEPGFIFVRVVSL